MAGDPRALREQLPAQRCRSVAERPAAAPKAVRSIRAASGSTPPRERRRATSSSALPRSLRRPVARVDLRRGEPVTRPGRDDPARRPSGHASSRLPRPARQRRFAPRREERDIGAHRSRERDQACRSQRAGSVALASRSALPASALPPPIPAPTGASFSIRTRQPAAWPARAASSSQRARHERVAAGRAPAPRRACRAGAELEPCRRRRARASTVASSW